MADVTVGGGELRIELTVPERVLSLHSAHVVVPLTDIRGVRLVRDILAQVRGLRMPGTGFPGVLAIGVWRGTQDGRRFHDFVLVHRSGPGVVITTAGKYSRVLIGSEAPEQLAEQLSAS